MAANLLVPDPGHAATAVRFALRAQEEAAKVPRPDVQDGSTLQMRIGEASRFSAVRGGATCLLHLFAGCCLLLLLVCGSKQSSCTH